jgi:tetratricopeptide (TPR) repeat protein
VGSRTWLALALAERGEFGDAIARATEAIRIAEAVGHLFSVTIAYRGLGHVYLSQGELPRALVALEHSLSVCKSVEGLLSWVLSGLGCAHTRSGRGAEAIALLEQAVEGARAVGSYPDRASAHIGLGKAYLLVGRAADASVCARQALALARQHHERGNEADALRLLGEIAAHADPADYKQADSHYHRALALAEELGMRPLAAHCHLGLGTLYRKIDRHDQAQAELSAAAGLYRAMEMTFWLQRAEQAF